LARVREFGAGTHAAIHRRDFAVPAAEMTPSRAGGIACCWSGFQCLFSRIALLCYVRERRRLR
jgi:hypothetical protein